MKVAEINMRPNGSTGKIMFQIARVAKEREIEVKTFSPVEFSRIKRVKTVVPIEHYIFGSFIENGLHYYLGEFLGRNGYFSFFGTLELIRRLKEFKPDIIHLHNLHCFCINLKMLFDYIKKNNIKVIWTLHDCWSFTGHCPHFTLISCDKWKKGCCKCPQPNVYPRMYVDTSKMMYNDKKKWFLGVRDMTLVTPSKWLADLVNQSFLKNYKVKVINNGIDLNVFKYTISNRKNELSISDEKYVVLGVAFNWGNNKGLDVFQKLANELSSRYQIVLVGTNENIEKNIDKKIITIRKTNNQKELAEIYSIADIFVNPTREDNFPTTNLEALACGIPVITFKTGGSPEAIDDNCGVVIECDDYNGLKNNIIDICEKKYFSSLNCRKRAEMFDMNQKFNEYVDLFC